MPRGRTYDHDRTEKLCPKCGQVLTLDQFNKNRARSDGYASWCKRCKYEGYKPHRYTPEKKDRLVAITREWRQQNPERWKAQRQRYDQAHRAENRARLAVKRAVRAGRLARQPCERCGNPSSEAHHYLGYEPAHRFDVQWLCSEHHGEAHRTAPRTDPPPPHS